MKYLNLARKILLYGSLLTPLLLFFPIGRNDLGEWAWDILLLTLAIGPLSKLFPKFRPLMIAMTFRQGLGVLCGMLAMLHVFTYFWGMKLNPFLIFQKPIYWDYKLGLFWGIIATIIMSFLLTTSNRFSMIRLKKWWRRLHWLSHPLLILVAIHIILIKRDDIGETLAPVILIVALWIAAWTKKQLTKRVAKALPENQ